MNIAKAIVAGALTRDPELRYGEQDNKAYARFTVAVNRGQATDFVNCVAFGVKAENITKYFRKGSRIYVEGNLRSNTYTNRDNVKITAWEVSVTEFDFVDKKSESTAATTGSVLPELDLQ